MDALHSVLIGDDDVGFEEELARNPFALKTWLQFIASKKAAPAKARFVLYERALAQLPGSYKLWHAYLQDRVAHVAGRSPTDPRREVVNNAFERALVFMHKMPVVWLEYCAFLVGQRQLTRTRRTFDRALQSLPITQHERVWPPYLAFVRDAGVWETCVRVNRRYLQFDGTGREDYVEFLLSIGNVDEAAVQMAVMVNDERFVSLKGHSKHAVWMQLCDLVSRHPGRVTSLRVDPVLRSGIRRFTDEVGRLWCALAEYYVRGGAFEKARDVYEEAIAEVSTVRDFATVFDAYSQFEEAMLTAKMELAVKEGGGGGGGDSSSGGSGSGAALVSSARDLDDLEELQEAGDDTELRIARLELLMDRRPLLLSSVLLRQNPHNVHEWHKRAKLYKEAGAPDKVVTTYTEAVRTVDPLLAVGKPFTLWTAFARYYEDHRDVDSARVVFRQAVASTLKTPEDLAHLWCEWAEMELRAGAHAEALRLMAEAASEGGSGRGGRQAGGAPAAPAAAAAPGGGTASSAAALAAVREASRSKLHRSLRVWGLFLDLSESLDTVEAVKAAYARALQLKVATPAMVLNFASYLEERSLFEESFRAFERGVAVFPWPHVKELWLAYLRKFLERYGGSKIERARELFEQAVAGAPPAEAATLFKMYAAMEETHGLVRHAMAVYDRATRAVEEGARYDMFLTYLRKAEEFYGAPRTREIYERAVESLPDAQVKDMCLRFAGMETKLGESERARAIYAHASQFCDPRVATEFWATWQDFEVAHGNEDSFREMLRVKRSVAAAFSSVNYGVAEMLGGGAAAASSAAAAVAAPKPAAAPAPAPSVLGKRGAPGGTEARAAGATGARPAPAAAPVRPVRPLDAPASSSGAVQDDAEIAIDEDDGGGDGGKDVEMQAVPAAVFGGLQAAGGGGGGGAGGGALERFKAKERQLQQQRA